VKIRLLTPALIPILILYLTGCSTARQLSLPGPTDDPERPTAKVGMTVTVRLLDREQLEGTVIAVSPDTLVLGKGGNYGWQEMPIATDRIASIEIREATALTKTMVVLTAVGLMVALVVAVVYGSAISAADLS
jgi:hypothetical protein